VTPTGAPRPHGPRLLSVVAPARDEQELLPAFVDRTLAMLDGLGAPAELVLVDDGSSDATWAAIASASAADERVRGVRLSRGFGHQAALSCGIAEARGDVVVTIDADLQDPPELVPELLLRWRAGADVVSAVRRRRDGETAFKRWSAGRFYRLIERLSDVELERDAGDYRLMDRRCVDELVRLPERARYLRGLASWIGFVQDRVPYDRAARAAGRTKFSLPRMSTFALDALASFSNVPLRAATLLGFACATLAFLLAPLTILARLFNVFSAGVPTLLVAVLLLGGIQLITLGILGEYVGRVYDEVKQRPLFLVADRTDAQVAGPDPDPAP
jgi:dolichol-phosphate mannosyltransferase